jgi:hypothetical protein
MSFEPRPSFMTPEEKHYQVALRRIKGSGKDGSSCVRFSGLSFLPRLPPELKRLTSLQSLRHHRPKGLVVAGFLSFKNLTFEKLSRTPSRPAAWNARHSAKATPSLDNYIFIPARCLIIPAVDCG